MPNQIAHRVNTMNHISTTCTQGMPLARRNVVSAMAALLMILLMTGCSSIAMREYGVPPCRETLPSSPYPGVKFDVALISGDISANESCSKQMPDGRQEKGYCLVPSDSSRPVLRAALDIVYGVIDIPFSFVIDTAFLYNDLSSCKRTE